PSADPALAGADSLDLLTQAWARIRNDGWQLANADVVLVGEEPRLAPHRDEMRRRLAVALDVEPELVAVRATTTDGLGFTGRGEGLAAQAVALLVRRSSPWSRTPSTRSCRERCRTSGPSSWRTTRSSSPSGRSSTSSTRTSRSGSSPARSGDAQPSATRAACPSAGTGTRRRAASTGR